MLCPLEDLFLIYVHCEQLWECQHQGETQGMRLTTVSYSSSEEFRQYLWVPSPLLCLPCEVSQPRENDFSRVITWALWLNKSLNTDPPDTSTPTANQLPTPEVHCIIIDCPLIRKLIYYSSFLLPFPLTVVAQGGLQKKAPYP